MEEKLKLLITPPEGGTREAAALCQSITWGGSYDQAARTLDFPLLVCPEDKRLPAVDCPPGSRVQLYRGERLLFDGFVFSRQRDTLSNTVEVSCADRGLYLKRNQGAYRFRGQTPEGITGRVAADFGLTVGSLARTGTAISRNFPGVSLYQIIQTAYTQASAATGGRYVVRFRGEALEVIEKKQGERTLALRPGSNLISLTATDSVERLVNRVQILSRDGTAKGSPVEDGASIARYGLFQQMVTERSGRDAAAEARKLLEDNAPAQKITAQVRGNPALITGECVVLQEPVTGLYGLCWIDSDTHTWKGGVYTTKLVLNFRNLMDEAEAGKLPDA
ncbi:XkdQ/YqbQ family protein [Intestinimonas butyriciproducens]|uniref:XkdQ/YqbQ family protein n=1 Tax=Intestinimonas butyriciproducens TaxID=1297617 RepID=UPI00189D4CE3|nr:hypothetical protein [Intestinimonas butyriciproducens]